MKHLHPIDIIIPAYRNAALTQRCLESVIAAPVKAQFVIVVIDDNSPEPELKQYLRTLAAQDKICLLENATNRGFAASVNAGMHLHPERDVVLLNSDAEVANDWLDRLLACARDQPRCGAVTPFSNNATLASYPVTGRDNALPAGWDVARLDRLCATVNAGRRVAIPTGVGFCMFIARRCLNTIGYFDEQTFAQGYGEENDFCLRASAAGFTHWLAADVFVLHAGEASFGALAAARKTHAEQTIDRYYPHYRQLIADFFAADPVRPLRQQLDWARLAWAPQPRLLFVTHHWGGGAEKHVQALAMLLAPEAEVVIMRPLRSAHRQSGVELCWGWDETAVRITFALPSAAADAEADNSPVPFLRALNFSRIHIHHVHGYPATILNLPDWLHLPYDCTLHDYYPACPHYSFVAATGHYCGEPETAGCHTCLTQRPGQWHWPIDLWRQRFAAFLTNAQRVFIPSKDMAERLSRYFPMLHPVVLPHPELPAPAPRPWRKVLILGGLSPVKGLHVVAACAQDAKARSLPLFFRVLGHTSQPVAQWPALPLSVAGEYRDEDLPDLIALERSDVIFFPSQVPESYSYILTTAMQSRLPIVAADFGALSERLRSYPRKVLLPWNSEAAAWNDRLLSLSVEALAPGDQEIPAPLRPEQYLAVYHQGLYFPAFDPVAEATLPALPPTCSVAPEPSLEFAALYEFGVECGHAESAAELRRRLGEVDNELRILQELRTQYSQLQEQYRQLQRLERESATRERAAAAHINHLETALTAARARIEELETSTSWRVTRPLRWCGEKRKHWQRASRRLVYQARLLPRRTTIAGQILHKEGVYKLLERIRHKLRRDRLAAFPKPTFAYHLAATITPLQLPTTEKPEYSIVLPVYEQHLHTFSCLQSIAQHTPPGTYEVLVVDDCSLEPAATALAAVQGLRWIRNAENCGFLRTANRGISLARADYVVLLNNDTLVTPGWLTALREVLDRQPDAGVVGAKLIYPDGTLQEAGGIMWRDGSGWNYGNGDDPAHPRYNYVRSVDYCSAACWLFRRDFFTSLHGFDEAYAPAYYEDTDFAFRMRAAGKHIYYQPAATIVHFEGASCGRDESAGIKQHQAVNRETFLRRWHQALSTHRLNGIDADLEKDRGCRYRVLVIDACMLAPDEDSGSVRMWAIFKELRTLGAKVTFVADNLGYREPYVQALQQAGVEVLYYPYLGSVEEYLQYSGKCFDLIIISRYYIAAPYVKTIRRYAPQALFVFDTVDLHYLREERLAALEQSTPLRATAATTRKQELGIIARADVTLVVSPVEQEILRRELPQANVQVLSNIHEVAGSATPFAARRDILFVGGFRHPPNVDAVHWYCDAIWPLVHEHLPDVRTLIVGSDMPQRIYHLAVDGIEVLGHVPAIEPVLARVRVSIAPLRYGAGVKGKVNISMSHGVPVVATPSATEGAYLVAGENVLVAETAAEFAAALIHLYQDPVLWEKLSANGLANIRQHFSPDVARSTLLRLLSFHQQAQAIEQKTWTRQRVS